MLATAEHHHRVKKEIYLFMQTDKCMQCLAHINVWSCSKCPQRQENCWTVSDSLSLGESVMSVLAQQRTGHDVRGDSSGPLYCMARAAEEQRASGNRRSLRLYVALVCCE